MRNETTRQEWEVRLREQAVSGLGIKAWCEREGLKASSFHYWRNQLAPRPATPTRLIALPMPGSPSDPALELRTPQGYLIRLSSAEQVGWLDGVLAALR